MTIRTTSPSTSTCTPSSVRKEAEKESINDDVVFEIELIKQVEVNVDYMLMLVEKWRDARGNGADREMDALLKIQRAIDSSITLRNKRDLILDFVDSMTVTGDVNDDWERFVAAKRAEELARIITEENLKPDETHAFVEAAFRDGARGRPAPRLRGSSRPSRDFLQEVATRPRSRP